MSTVNIFHRNPSAPKFLVTLASGRRFCCIAVAVKFERAVLAPPAAGVTHVASPLALEVKILPNPSVPLVIFNGEFISTLPRTPAAVPAVCLTGSPDLEKG